MFTNIHHDVEVVVDVEVRNGVVRYSRFVLRLGAV